MVTYRDKAKEFYLDNEIPEDVAENILTSASKNPDAFEISGQLNFNWGYGRPPFKEQFFNDLRAFGLNYVREHNSSEEWSLSLEESMKISLHVNKRKNVMTTFNTQLHRYLTDNGMSDSQADSVMSILKEQLEEEEGQQKVLTDIWEDYPSSMHAVMIMRVKSCALDYIVENCPKAWFRPMFDPDMKDVLDDAKNASGVPVV